MTSLVLVVTSLEDVTADMVIAALNERGVPLARVDPGDSATSPRPRPGTGSAAF
ncbi:hypothetical protein [Microbispora sp. NBC_01389]|uniref:hypothetical protein n=1 Tax=Microbispora sp. NBC_01389 TaxID=2903584 RepID=UPI00324DEA63